MKELRRQFAVFGGVGTINTVFTLVLIALLSEIFDVHYLVANLLGYLAGLILSFYLHKFITFKATSSLGKTKDQIIKFCCVFAVAYVVQFLFVGIAVGHWGWFNLIGQVAGSVIYVLISFVGNRMLTFSVPKQS